MNRKTAFGLAAAAVLVAAGLAVAAPALAGYGPGSGSDDRPGAGHMMGQGSMMDRGWGGDGGCWMADGAAAGELTAEQETTLAAVAEEHKLARDLYAAFADQYGERVFERLATAESRQLAALTRLLDRYGVADPTDGRADGEFASAQRQERYDRLLTDGSAGLAAALTAGQAVEESQQSLLDGALDGLTAPDVTMAYEHLLTATQRHLTALDNAG